MLISYIDFYIKNMLLTSTNVHFREDQNTRMRWVLTANQIHVIAWREGLL